MRYIFYADVYFIQNFMMKVAAIYLVLYTDKNTKAVETIKGLVRPFVVAFLGTIMEIIGLMLLNSYNMFLLLVNIVELPIMFRLIMGDKWMKCLRLSMLGYFFIIMINGMVEVMWNYFGEYGSYIFFLVFSAGVAIVGVRIWRNYNKMQKGILRVKLLHKGEEIQENGFYDSGNRLIDPYSGKGVHIVSEQLLKHMEVETPVYISYQALGNKDGVLEVYYIDELVIEGEKQKRNIQNCPVGVTKDNLFKGKNYKIILNEEVF